MQQIQNRVFGFTLVELIVVITIVGILSTVGFVSYSGYLTGARDSNRISQMVKLSDSLQVYSANKSLPLPDDKIDLTASGIVFAYQGEVGVDVLETIDYTNGGTDPKDDSYYTYVLTKDRKSHQLMAMMEEQITTAFNLTKNINAVSYEERYSKVYGNKLGVLTYNDSANIDLINTPANLISENKTVGGLDIINTPINYNVFFDNKNIINGTGSQLKILESIVQEGGFKDSLVVWYDMETPINSGLKDLSGKGNNAARIGTEVIPGNSEGVFGASTSFESFIGGFSMPNTEVLQSDKFSISLWQKTNNILGVYDFNISQYDSIINQWDCTGGSCDDKGGGEWWLGNRLLVGNTSEIINVFGSGSTNTLVSKEKNTYPDSKWHHLVLVKSGDQISLYVDGRLSDIVQSSSSKEIGATLPLYIGTSGHTSNILNSNATIDEVRIYNTSLDEDEVNTIYRVGTSKL